MGDRCTVTLSVLKEHESQARTTLGEDFSEEYDLHSNINGLRFIEFIIESVNYGVLEDVEIGLLRAGIPYDYGWSAGDEYSGGTACLRFDEHGVAHYQYWYEEEENTVPLVDLEKILSQENTDPETMLQTIRQLVADTKKYTTVPTWNHQFHNAKKVRLLRLVAPDDYAVPPDFPHS